MNRKQMINEFFYSSALNLVDEFFQEIYNYLASEEGKKYPKRLENNIDKRKANNWRSILEDKKRNLGKKTKFVSNKKKTIQNHKPIPKYILYEDEKDKEKYYVVLRTYISDDYELHRIKEIANSNKYDPLIIKDTQVKRHQFGQYQKMSKKDSIKLLNINMNQIKIILLKG